MAVSTWFDYKVYLNNKLAQLVKAEPNAGWDMGKLMSALSDAGFKGEAGYLAHFEQYGQNEDVAPNAFFNVDEYYRAKAVQYTGKTDAQLDAIDINNIKLAIKDAGMNAWSHYEKYGSAEGVNPSNAFNSKAYLEAKLEVLKAAEPTFGWDMPKLNAALSAAGLSALEHFMLYAGTTGEVAEGLTADGKIPAKFEVPAENKVTPGGGGAGSVFTLTKAGAVLTSDSSLDVTPAGHLTTGNDTINALSYASGSTIMDASTTDHDTLNVIVQAATVPTMIKNIETINLSMMKTSADFSLAAVSGAQEIVVSGVTAGKVSGFDTVSATAPKVVLKDYASMLTVVPSTVNGTTDHVSVSLQNTTLGAGLNLGSGNGASNTALELLNISSDGKAANVVELRVDGTNVESVTKTVITGKQDLTLVAGSGGQFTFASNGDADDVAFKTVDASGHEGKLTLQIGKDSADTTVGEACVNLSGFKGLDKLVLHDGNLINVTHAASGLAIDLNSDSGSLSYTIDGNAAAVSGVDDILNINLVNAKQGTITGLDLANSGFETVNLHNTGMAHTITTLTGNTSKLTDEVVITGDKDLTITNALVGVDVLDAREFDGKLTTTGGGAESVTIYGSDQNDTYKFVTAAAADTDGVHDTVTMGKGGDTIDLTGVAGWESYGYATGAGASAVTSVNLFKFNEGDSVASSKADVFGFDANSVDTFTGVQGTAFAAATGAKFAIDTWMDTTEALTQNAGTDLYGKAAKTNEFGVYVKSDIEAYVYQNTNGDNVFGEGDFMVKITGTALTASDFTVADGNLLFVGAAAS